MLHRWFRWVDETACVTCWKHSVERTDQPIEKLTEYFSLIDTGGQKMARTLFLRMPRQRIQDTQMALLCFTSTSPSFRVNTDAMFLTSWELPWRRRSNWQLPVSNHFQRSSSVVGPNSPYKWISRSRFYKKVFILMCFLWLGIPKFPKEGTPPIVVTEGEPIILHCNPPEGAAPRQLYWMSIGKPRSYCLFL